MQEPESDWRVIQEEVEAGDVGRDHRKEHREQTYDHLAGRQERLHDFGLGHVDISLRWSIGDERPDVPPGRF